MTGVDLLGANLAALAGRDPGLAAAVQAAIPAADVRVERARNGVLVPVVAFGGRDWFLHSRYDPRAEATRAAGALPRPAYAVVLGIGGGYHVRALLEDAGISGVLVAESDAAHLKAIAAAIPLQDLFADPRVAWAVAEPPAGILSRLAERYQPLLCGPLVTLPLEPRIRTAPAYFAAVVAAVTAAGRRAAEDASVQARFGRRWFSNILGNLPSVQTAADWPRIDGRALVAAAGPTLHAHLDAAAQATAGGAALIAADTALPALQEAGITPTMVLSLDCQIASYHHFMGRLPQGCRLALDVGSPPLLARMAGKPLFLASPHPLAALVSRTMAPLPPLDSSGGNVTHAAVALAFLLGAQEVEIAGADFSYPGGTPYARGTYFHPYYQSRATRLAPSDSGLVSFVLAESDLPACSEPAGPRYRSRRLERYREALAERFGPLDELPGGLLLCHRPPGTVPLTAGGTAARWRPWLAAYRAALGSLPRPRAPIAAFWAGLEAQQRVAWATLLPAAAAMPAGAAHERLERALSWCLRRVEERLHT